MLQVIAHRGANREAPENSLEAFEIAIDSGADMIELDLRLAADGSCWVIHDDTLAQPVVGKYKLSEMTANEVAELRLENQQGVPSLEEVMTFCQGRIPLNLELKTDDPDIAQAILTRVKHHPDYQAEQVLISCFSADVLQALNKTHPDLTLAQLWEDDKLEPLAMMQKSGAKIWHPRADKLTPELGAQARELGYRINAWYPMAEEMSNPEADWQRLVDIGVHGICTNLPRRLKAWLGHEI